MSIAWCTIHDENWHQVQVTPCASSDTVSSIANAVSLQTAIPSDQLVLWFNNQTLDGQTLAMNATLASYAITPGQHGLFALVSPTITSVIRGPVHPPQASPLALADLFEIGYWPLDGLALDARGEHEPASCADGCSHDAHCPRRDMHACNERALRRLDDLAIHRRRSVTKGERIGQRDLGLRQILRRRSVEALDKM